MIIPDPIRSKHEKKPLSGLLAFANEDRTAALLSVVEPAPPLGPNPLIARHRAADAISLKSILFASAKMPRRIIFIAKPPQARPT
jgi:hypothetical protein